MWSVRWHARGFESLTKSQLNEALRLMMHAVGLRHRRRHLAKHFTKAAYRAYGYAPRQGDNGSGSPFRGSYQYRKLRKFSHTLPLVYTGELRRLTLYGRQDVRATAAGGNAKARIVLPRKANLRNPWSLTNPLKELQAVSGAEMADLERFAGEQLERELKAQGASGASAGVNIVPN